MPKGVPVGTVAIGQSGAENSALLAAKILALGDEEVSKRLKNRISENSNNVAKDSHIGTWLE